MTNPVVNDPIAAAKLKAEIDLNAMALVGMSEDDGNRSDEERGRLVEAIVRDSADVVSRHTDDTGFNYPISATAATAVAA